MLLLIFYLRGGVFWNAGLNFWEVKHMNPTDKYPKSDVPHHLALTVQKLFSIVSQHLALSGNYCVILFYYCANIRSTARQNNFLEWNSKRLCSSRQWLILKGKNGNNKNKKERSRNLLAIFLPMWYSWKTKNNNKGQLIIFHVIN